MGKIIKSNSLNEPISIRRFYEKRNKILIYRKQGGLGDVLMHRMMFEDFKKLNPNIHIAFACPSLLMDSVKDHPFIDEICPSENVDISNYNSFYNTSYACVRYETRVSPLSDKHRSDIWAEHCGVKLTSHNMHLNISDAEMEHGQNVKKSISNNPSIVICPVSAMPSKNLLPHQIEAVIGGIKKLGFAPYVLHKIPIQQFEELDVPVIYGQSIRQWMGILAAADYVLSVDTAAFHLAGGLGKPLTGVFTWADGMVYGKYFDFILIQKHRKNGDWDCGPCYKWPQCPLTKGTYKPCITEITGEMILNGVVKMINKHPK